MTAPVPTEDLQTQIADLRRRLDELLALPEIERFMQAKREREASIEHAARVAEQDERRREHEDAAIRKRVERDPVVVVTCAPGVKRVFTRGGFDVAVKGDKYKGGIAIDGFGQPVPAEHRMLHSQWLSLLASDVELHEHVHAGRLQVDTVPIDRVVADVRNGRDDGRLYQHSILTVSYR